MRGVTIRDYDPATNTLSFDLRDILALLGSDAARSDWRVRDVECVGGEAAEALHRSSDAGEVVAGTRLIELARDVGQIIDGEFSARLPEESADWITVRAVDSSAFDVLTDRDEVLAALSARFVRVSAFPP